MGYVNSLEGNWNFQHNEFFIPQKNGGSLPERLHGATWPWIPPTVGFLEGGGEGEGLRKLYRIMICYATMILSCCTLLV